MYKATELREKSREDLLKLISELKGKLLALRFEAATGQLNETHLPSSTKKDIALIFTVLKEKENGIIIKAKVIKKPTKKIITSNKNIKPIIEQTKLETTATINKEINTSLKEDKSKLTPIVKEVKIPEKGEAK